MLSLTLTTPLSYLLMDAPLMTAYVLSGYTCTALITTSSQPVAVLAVATVLVNMWHAGMQFTLTSFAFYT